VRAASFVVDVDAAGFNPTKRTSAQRRPNPRKIMHALFSEAA